MRSIPKRKHIVRTSHVFIVLLFNVLSLENSPILLAHPVRVNLAQSDILYFYIIAITFSANTNFLNFWHGCTIGNLQMYDI